MNCINIQSEEYKELLEASKLPSLLLEMRIAKWQEQNGLDSFPKVEDIQSNEVVEVKENDINKLLDPKVTKEVFAITDLDSSKTTSEVDNSQVNKQLLFNTNNQNSLLTAEVLTNIIEQIPDNLTDEFKVLIDKARKVLNNTKAKVEVSTIEEMSNKYKNVDSTVAMLYDANTNKIVISEEALTKLTSQEVVQSFIHEVVHAIVVKAIKNPQTFEEKEAKKFFEKAFEKYKRLAAEKSSKKESYGFTNIDEFIAEIYSNPEFQNELKEIQGFWNELKNVIRRLINMIKSLVNDELIDATLLINRVNNLVEQTNNSDFKGYSAESGIRFDAMFIRNTVLSESEGYNLDTIEKQIQNVLNKAKDILNQNIAHYKAVTKSIKDPVKKQQWTKFVDSFDDTLNSLETLKDGEELTGILNYVNSLQKGVASLKSSFDKKEFTEEETIQVVHNYTKYLDSFTIHKDIQKLLSDIKVNNKFDSDTIDISEIEDALDSVVSDYTKLKSEYSAFLKNAIKLKLSTLKYLPKLETMWINKLKTEYKSSPKSISQTEWIANAMNTTYKEDIDADIEDYLNKLINNPSFDISIGTHFLSSAVNTNSQLIQIFNQILTEVKEEINQTMREKEAELKILFDELVKEKGSSSTSVLYKNLVFKNPNGNYSLVNDEKGLSKIEKEVLKGLKDIQDYTDYSTYRKQSKKVKINGNVYYELPSITKSDLERVLEGDIKGTIKDKWTDLTTIKADDVEFRYKTDNDHNLIYNVPVRYRAKIEAKDQSLDLFTVYRLEYLNGVNFKVKTKAEKDLTTIIDIAKSKEYYREEGGLKEYVKSTFTKNNEIELTPGEKSNTLKMLNSLLETNIYDIGHRYAGKTGKVDNNKLLGFLNGSMATIGLSLNRFGATANVLNAKAQMFLESISKGTINNKNLLKAEALYTKELLNTMKDLGQPVEKSFINQMNRMFDTFGFNQNAMNDFVKQGILKSYSNLGTLQFMHKTGEHWVQSVLTAAVLDSVKVMNSDNRFIDKKGNEVSEDKAASLLDMLYIDSKDGILKISDKVVYTTKSLTSKINEGGKEKINLLVDRKIKDCFGNYNPTTQPEASRHVWGKLILPFRRFYMEMATKRFKAFGTSSKSKDEIEANPRYKHYNYALQAYDEGTYTSLARFLRHGVIPMLKQMKFHILSQEWEKLSDLERANIKHSVSEITATLVILPLIGMLLGNMLGGNDDDDEMIYFWMYQTRRLTTELAQFRNPSENIKMTRSPIPSMRLIENGIDAIGKTLNFWSWDEEIKSGPNKGDLKIAKSYKKLIPVLNQIDKNSKDLYKYQTAMFGSY